MNQTEQMKEHLMEHGWKYFIAIWLILITLFGVTWLNPKQEKITVRGGYENLMEMGGCSTGNKSFSLPLDLLEFSPSPHHYEIDDTDLKFSMDLNELVVIRLFNKELDRYIADNNMTLPDELDCWMHASADYSFIVDKDGKPLIGLQEGTILYTDNSINCTAPDGLHYECDFQEKLYLHKLFNDLLSEINRTTRREIQ